MKTSELTGLTLDWAVAKCEGFSDLRRNPHKFGNAWIMTPPRAEYGPVEISGYAFSADWSQGGPIIEREIAVIRKGEQSAIWFASIMDASMDYMTYEGPTPLIAAMRCYVASKLGDEVEIPEELQS